MKKLSAFWLTIVLFGAINIFEGISSYGKQAVDLPPVQLQLFWVWVFIRNTIAYTLVLASLVFLLGKKSRIFLTVFFCLCYCCHWSMYLFADGV